jgi:hypothetical protein
MGRAVEVEAARPLAEALAELAAGGVAVTVLMIDGALVPPNTAPPPSWSDVRLKTPAGTFALKRAGARVSVVAFGNADDATVAMMHRLAAALAATSRQTT